MDSRVVLDLLSPSPVNFAFAAASRHPSAPASTPVPNASGPALLPGLRSSLKSNFPPPPSTPLPPVDRVIPVSSLPELQRAILSARSQRRRVRASTAPLASSSNRRHLAAGGIVIDMSPLNKLTFHASRSVVVAQAAVSLRELHAAAERDAFSLRVHVPFSSSAPSVAAAVAVGALGGGGANEALFSDAVVEVSLVDAFGRLRVYSRTDRTGLFNAVKLSLGLFGVIYDVTIQVDRFRRVAQVANRFVPLRGLVGSRVPKALQRMVEARAGVELNWFPFNSCGKAEDEWEPERDIVWMRTLERIMERADKPKVQLEDDDDVAYRFLTIPQWFSLNATTLAREGYAEYRPDHAKLFLGLGFEQTAWKLESKPFAQSVAHAVQYHDNSDMFPVVNVAVAFPLRPARDEDWKTVQEAWRVVMRRVKECEERGEYPLNMSLKTNFVKASDALLAANFASSVPGKKNAYSAVVQICSAKHTKGWEGFAKDVVKEWMRLPGSRCRLSRDLVTACDADTVVASLGESLQSFKVLRKNAGVDDIGIFLDEPFAELLGMTEQRSDFTSSPVSSSGSMHSRLRLKEMDTLLGCGPRIANGPNEDNTANGSATVTDREDTVSRSPSAVITQSNLPWTPQSSTPSLFPSPVPSRASLFDDNDGRGEEEYERDDNDFDDDESFASDEAGNFIPPPVYKRLPARRRKMARYQSPLTSPEFSLLFAYVAMYTLLWLVLFGRPAARQLGWIS